MHEHDQSQSVLKSAFSESNLKYLTVFVFLAFISKSVNNRCYNPYIDGKISNRSTKKSLRKRKNSKIYSRQFPIQNATRIFLKTKSGIVCYKFSNSSVFVETFFVNLFEIFPSM